jgi:hypothetical protein
LAFLLLATASARANQPASPSAAASAPRFLLLIHGGDGPVADRGEVVNAYRDWARRLSAEGKLVEADELAEEAVVLSAGSPGAAPRRSSAEPSAGGYFLVSAPDLEAAVAIAQGCPALTYGGSVEVVAIRH